MILPSAIPARKLPRIACEGTAVVNEVIDAVLARPDGPIPAGFIIDLIGEGIGGADGRATEDRARTHGYLLEMCYILGFKGAPGHFALDGSFRKPDRYGEPFRRAGQPRTSRVAQIR